MTKVMDVRMFVVPFLKSGGFAVRNRVSHSENQVWLQEKAENSGASNESHF